MVKIIMGQIIGNYKIVKGALFFFLLVLCSSNVLADLPEEDLFGKAYEYYLSCQPDKALEYFDIFLQNYPDSFARDAALFWKARSLIQLRRRDEAVILLEGLREAVPASPFLPFIEKELAAREGGAGGSPLPLMPAGKTMPRAGEQVDQDDMHTIALLKKEKIILEEHVIESEKLRQQAEKELSSARADSVRIEGLLHDAQKSTEDLLMKIASMESAQRTEGEAHRKDETEALETEIESRDRTISEFQQSISMLQERIRQLDSQRGEEKQEAGRIRDGLMGEKAALEEKLRETQQRMEELNARAQAAEDQIIRLTSARTADETTAAGVCRRQTDAAMTKLRQERDVLLQKSEDMTDKDREILDLSARVEEQQRKRHVAEALIQNLTMEKTAIEKRLMESETRVHDLMNESKRERARTAERGGEDGRSEMLARKLGESEEARRSLQESLTKTMQEFQRLQDDMQAERETRQQGEAVERERFAAQLQNAERERSETAARLQSVTDEKEALKGEIESIDRTLAGYQQSLGVLQDRIQQTEKQREEEKQEAGRVRDRLMAEKAAVEDELREARQLMATLHVRLEAAEKHLTETRSAEQSQRRQEADNAEKRAEALRSELMVLQDSLRSRESILAIKEREVHDLTGRVQELEKARKEADASLLSLLEEKTASAVAVREREDSLAGISDELQRERGRIAGMTEQLARARLLETQLAESGELNKRLQQQIEKLSEQADVLARERERVLVSLSESEERVKQGAASVQSLNDAYEREQKANAALRERERAIQTETLVLRDTIAHYQIPILQIGDDRFSLVQIHDDYQNTERVLKRIGKHRVSWREQNPYTDFVVEYLLLQRARANGIPEDGTTYQALLNADTFSAEERAAVRTYLLVSGYIQKKLGELVADEQYVRKYYELRKERYVTGTTRQQVKLLSLPYAPEEELEKSLMAVDYHQQVLSGRSLEAVYKFNANILSFDAIAVSDLPDFLKERIAGLKDGDISTLISYDNKFMIMQMQGRQQDIRAFADVSAELQHRVFEDQALQADFIRAWLDELRNRAELLN